MTKEKAIEILKCLLECNYVDSFEDEENEALEMAISALSENKGDLISRKEALKPYEKLNDNDVISVWLIRKNLEEQGRVDKI